MGCLLLQVRQHKVELEMHIQQQQTALADMVNLQDALQVRLQPC